jgi:uncharacterized protein (TIGR02145 family)
VFIRQGRTLLLTAMAVVVAVGLAGCDVDDNGTNSNGGGVSWNNTCGKDGTDGSCRKVVVGGQTWMAENLNVTTADSWCYENSADSCKKYGRLYTWAATKTACPNGWHLPSRDEWDQLAITAGGTGTYGHEDRAGTKLKSTSGWASYNGRNGGTDDYGFSALPGGLRYSDGRFGSAVGAGNWWSGKV